MTYAESINGIATITDGDTISIDGVKIRLHGIDAPESAQSCQNRARKTYSCGKQATDFLRSIMAAEKKVSCNVKDQDRYGRKIAVCFAGGKDLNALMVSSGHAIAYRQYSKDYVKQESQAKEAKLGVWQGRFVLPSKWRRGKRLASSKQQTGRVNKSGAIVKKSKSGICHDRSSKWYSRTKNFTSYPTLKACLDSGGRRPKK